MSGGNNGKVLTVSRKLAKILTDSRKSHHPIETLFHYPCYAILAGLISAIYLDWLSSQVSCVALVPLFFSYFPLCSLATPL